MYSGSGIFVEIVD